MGAINKEHVGSSFDDWLVEEGIYDDVVAEAEKAVLAYQLQKAMEEQHVSLQQIAEAMGTSRAAVHRVLDPKNTGVTLKTMVRSAHALGKKLQIALVD